jgi:dolichol kinase
VGVRDRRPRIFGKPIAGTAAFAMGAALAGTVATAHPNVSRTWWMVPGAVVAATTELLPLRIDDNLSIPIAAAAEMSLLEMLWRDAPSLPDLLETLYFRGSARSPRRPVSLRE